MQLEWLRNLKIGKEWGNDKERRYSKKRKQKRQNGKRLGEGSKLRAEGKVRKVSCGRPQTPGWETSRVVQDVNRGGEGSRQRTVPKHPGAHEDLSPAEVCDPERGTQPLLPGLMHSGHTVLPPSLQYVSLSCLGSCVCRVLTLATLLRAAAFITQLPVLERPSLAAPQLLSILVSRFLFIALTP